MNKLFSLILCMTLITLLSACSGGGTNATSASPATNGITFSFSKAALVSAKTTSKTVASVVLDPTARYASVTVKDTNGVTVLSNYKTDIYTLNGSYITATIPLLPGNYQLTEFLVLDSANKVLYLVPTQSATADIKVLVSTVLPLSIGVTKDQGNTVTLQILAPDNNASSNDYGYSSVSFNIVEYVGFMSSVQILDSSTNNWLLTDATLTVNGVSYNHPAQTTTLRVTKADNYTLVFGKNGYDSKSITLSANNIANYQTTPLVIVLTPTVLVYNTVTFNSNSGSAVALQSIVSGGVASRPANPSNVGYTFVDWFSDAGLSTTYNFSAPIVTDIILYAKWTTNTYNVTFNSNGGSAVSSLSVPYDTFATRPVPDPDKAGYTFAGWYSDSGLTTLYGFVTTVTSNLPLYAKWTTNSYAVTFNSNGGSAVSSQSVPYNTLATRPIPDPVKTGYIFGGWYSDAALTALFSFSAPITVDTTLYAKWTATVPFTADPSGQMITDNRTGLVWAKNAYVDGTRRSWQQALDYITTINSNNYLGKNDWRLPTKDELVSLVTTSQSASPSTWLIANGFTNVQAYYYWSSTSKVGYTSVAWLINMSDGNAYDGNMATDYYVWPVRGGQ